MKTENKNYFKISIQTIKYLNDKVTLENIFFHMCLVCVLACIVSPPTRLPL